MTVVLIQKSDTHVSSVESHKVAVNRDVTKVLCDYPKSQTKSGITVQRDLKCGQDTKVNTSTKNLLTHPLFH